MTSICVHQSWLDKRKTDWQTDGQTDRKAPAQGCVFLLSSFWLTLHEFVNSHIHGSRAALQRLAAGQANKSQPKSRQNLAPCMSVYSKAFRLNCLILLWAMQSPERYMWSKFRQDQTCSAVVGTFVRCYNVRTMASIASWAGLFGTFADKKNGRLTPSLNFDCFSILLL